MLITQRPSVFRLSLILVRIEGNFILEVSWLRNEASNWYSASTIPHCSICHSMTDLVWLECLTKLLNHWLKRWCVSVGIEHEDNIEYESIPSILLIQYTLWTANNSVLTNISVNWSDAPLLGEWWEALTLWWACHRAAALWWWGHEQHQMLVEWETPLEPWTQHTQHNKTHSLTNRTINILYYLVSDSRTSHRVKLAQTNTLYFRRHFATPTSTINFFSHNFLFIFYCSQIWCSRCSVRFLFLFLFLAGHLLLLQCLI